MARLLAGLPSDQFDVTVVALATRGGKIIEQIPDDIRVIDLQIDSLRDVTHLRMIWEELADTDVLVTSLYHSTQIGRVLGTLRRVPVILSWQHSERLPSTTAQRLFGLLSVLDTRVLADSEAAVEGATKYGVARKKVRRVPIAGIDVTEYVPVTHRQREPIRVGTLGRLTSAKNIQAVLSVAETLQDHPIEFHVGGYGPQRDELERDAARRGLHNVSFEGLVEDVPAFLSDLDIYFQPSRREGLCLTVVEAMAAGLPVVASGVGGLTETVVPGKTGFLEPPSATDAFVDHILELSSDPDLRAELGATGRERVVNCYSQERLVEAFTSVIAEI